MAEKQNSDFVLKYNQNSNSIYLNWRQNKAKTGGSKTNQRRFIYRRSLTHLVVMLGARIDVVEASMCHFNATAKQKTDDSCG